ncbi:MAG: hypothetical protein FWG10_00200 [Eubacteriaceae bacterium]|nr:hypothetical protein [Eubacteriaceae bacterium]
MMQVAKKFVAVDARFSEEGELAPLAIYWEDGRKYEIDKILDKRRAASLKAGGIGVRYTVRINGQSRFLWYEEPRWFVEAVIRN